MRLKEDRIDRTRLCAIFVWYKSLTAGVQVALTDWMGAMAGFIYSYIHIKFKTRVKTVKMNSEKHTQVYGMYNK